MLCRMEVFKDWHARPHTRKRKNKHASSEVSWISILGFFGGLDGKESACSAGDLGSIPKSRSSVQFSCSVVSDSLQAHELQHASPPCPSPTPRVYSNSCPLCWWCHPTISSSVIPFSSCLQSFPASGFFQMSQFFTWGGQSIRVWASASVIPMNIQNWFPLGWTGSISLQSKGLSRVFFNTTVQKH